MASSNPNELIGKTPAEAFGWIVSGDPAMTQLARRAVEHEERFAPPFYEARYRTKADPISGGFLNSFATGVNTEKGCLWPALGDLHPEGFGIANRALARKIYASPRPKYCDEAEDLFLARYRLLMSWLQNGTILMHGRTYPSAPNSPLPISIWRSEATEINWKDNYLLTEQHTKVDLELVHGTQLSPKELDGLTLPEAFRRFVLADVHVQDLVQRVEPNSNIDAAGVLQGFFWSAFQQDSFWWPLVLSGPTLSDLNLSFEGQFKGALDAAMSRLLAPLRGGSVVAKATKPNDDFIQIPRSVWQEEGMYLHAAEAWLGMWSTDPDKYDYRGPTTRFRNVELYVAPDAAKLRSDAQLVENGIAISGPTPKNKGGRPGTHQWLPALDRALECWHSEGEPDSGADLVRWMSAAFEDMKAPPPDDEQIARWLRKEMPRLWAKAKGGQN